MSHHSTLEKDQLTCRFSVKRLLLYIIERDAHCPENKGTEATGKKVGSTGAYLFGGEAMR
jgi:hypothetical protein